MRWRQMEGSKLTLLSVTTGPEKDIIQISRSASVNNAVWEMFAKSRKKKLWKLIADMIPVRRLVFLTQN
jgi:L-alanine-DL-glutamate epimerase-like enolase superfamily enzyme